MPTYEVKVGDRTFDVDAPDPNTAWAWANDIASKTPPKAKPETGGWSALKAGFESGAGSAAKGIGDLIGSDTLSKWGEEALHTAEKTHRGTTAADVEAADKQGILAGLGARTSKYITEPVGGAIGSIAGRYGAPMAVGAVAAPIATAAGAPVAATALIGGTAFATINALLHTGENVSRQKDTGAEVDRVKATAYGLGQAAIDQLGGRILAGPMQKLVGKTIGEEATILARKVEAGTMDIKDATLQLVQKASRVKDIAQATVQNAAVGTGMMVGDEALRRASANQGVLTPEALESYKEQAKMAVALSPFFGVAHGFGAQRGALRTLGEGEARRQAAEKKKEQEEAEKDVPDTTAPATPPAATAATPTPPTAPSGNRSNIKEQKITEAKERELEDLKAQLAEYKGNDVGKEALTNKIQTLEAEIAQRKAPVFEDVDVGTPDQGKAQGATDAAKPVESPTGGDAGVSGESGVPKTPGDAKGTERAGVPPAGENAGDTAAGKGTADGALTRENYWRPNPEEPNNSKSWQNTHGEIIHEVDYALPDGGRITQIIDSPQMGGVRVVFTNSKGERKVVVLNLEKGKEPYWSAKDLSDAQLKAGLGDALFNVAGKGKLLNEADYAAVVNRLRDVVGAREGKPSEAKTSAPLPPEYQAAADLIAAVDKGGVPTNTRKINQIARNLGLEVSKGAKPEETVQRIRDALNRHIEGKKNEAPKTEASEAEQTETQGQEKPAEPVELTLAQKQARVKQLESNIRTKENYLRDLAHNIDSPDYKPTIDALARDKADLAKLNEEIAKAGEVKPEPIKSPGDSAEKAKQTRTEKLDEISSVYDELRKGEQEHREEKGKSTVNDEDFELPLWDDLTHDQKQVYIDSILSNPSPNKYANHAKAAKALSDYRDRLAAADNQNRKRKLKANPEAEHYELNRRTYEKETGQKFPAWDELTDAERETYRASLQSSIDADVARIRYERKRAAEAAKPKGETMKAWEELTPEEQKVHQDALSKLNQSTKVNLLNAEHHDKAFLAVHEERVKRERATKAEREAKAKAEREKNERLLREQEARDKRREDDQSKLQAAADRARESEAYLPNEQVRNIKSGETDVATKLLNWFINSAPDTLHREVAKLIRAIGLNPTIKFVEKLPKGRLAQYDPRTNTILVTTDGLKPSILLHELVHGSTVNVIDKFLTGRKGELTKEQIAGVEHLQELMRLAKEDPVMREVFPEAFKDLHEFVAYAMSDRRFQRHLEAIKEVIAPVDYGMEKSEKAEAAKAGETKGSGKPDLDATILPEKKSLLSSFMHAVLEAIGGAHKILFGGKKIGTAEGINKFYSKRTGDRYRTNPLAEAFAAFERIISAPPEGGVDLKPMGATATGQTKKAPTATPKEQVESIKRPIEEQKSTLHWTRHFMTRNGYNWLVSKFQNKGVFAKNLETALERAGQIFHTGPKMNNFWTQRKLSFARAAKYVQFYVNAPAQSLHNAIREYAKENKVTPKEALETLHLVMTALHEPERRAVKYLKLVPLDENRNITLKPEEQSLLATKDTTISAAEYRELVFKRLAEGKGLSEKDLKDLRKGLDDVVAKHVDPVGGYSEAGLKTADINDSVYNVIGMLNKDGVKLILDEHYKTPDQKRLVDNVSKHLQGLNDVTTYLNKEGRYWSEPVQNTVGFYGWKNYIPMKGKKGLKTADPDDFLDFERMGKGRGLQEDLQGFGGRSSPSDNPILMALADANRAASRAGSADLTLAIKNAVEQGLIKGKPEKPVTFKERSTTDVMNKYKKEDYVFHFQEDGSVVPIYIDRSGTEGKIIDGLREEYQAPHPVVNFANGLTGTMGQMHTRFNFAFAPMNFIRDAMTNILSTSAEMGMGTAAKYLGKVITDLGTGQIFRAGRMAHLYETGNKAEIERLAGGNKAYDQLSRSERYYRDLYEYIDQGGKVSYLQGISLKSQFKDVQKELNSGVPSKVRDTAVKVFDLWTDSFELAARASAYSIAKGHYLKQESAKQGVTPSEALKTAEVRAASYAKSLANFEEVGQWGRAMGAVFMFFRPSATGAVRAIDALTPAIMSLERAKYELPESVRNDPKAMAKFEADYNQHRKMAMLTTGVLFGMGAAVYQMSRSLSDNDDEGRNRTATDDINRWQRYARFFIPGMENPIQMPWGYGMGAFAALGAQLSAMGQGAASAKDVMGNAVSIFLDSFLPIPVSRINILENPAQWAVDSTTPSAFRPLLEWAMNMNTMGQEIYNNRQTRMGDAYTGGDNIPEIFKDLARWIADKSDGELDFSPNTLYFFANNYVDGISKLAEVGTNLGYVATGKKDFNPKTDTLILNSFIGAKSNYDARQYAAVEKKVQKMESVLNMFKTNPERYAEYMAAHPEAKFVVDYYHKQTGGMLKKLQHQAKVIRQDSSLTPLERKEALKDVMDMQNIVKRNIIDTMAEFDITP